MHYPVAVDLWKGEGLQAVLAGSTIFPEASEAIDEIGETYSDAIAG